MKIFNRFQIKEKSTLSLNELHKKRLEISIQIVICSILILVLKNINININSNELVESIIKLVEAIMNLMSSIVQFIVCAIMIKDMSIPYKYNIECHDELAIYNDSKANNYIINIIVLIFLVLSMISIFINLSIKIDLSFPTLVIIFHIFRLMKISLFLKLDHIDKDD